MPAQELLALLSSPAAIDDLASRGPGALLVEGTLPAGSLPVPPLLPLVVVTPSAVPDPGDAPAPTVDVHAEDEDLERVLAAIEAAPLASASLAVLLRASESRSVAEGLLAESAVYGVLQAGPEFRTWRVGNPVRDRRRETGDAVHCRRQGDTLHVRLSRPAVCNALDAQMRDALAGCLQVAATDPGLTVRLSGDGPAFCSGGHLDEFGSRADPATAHILRLTRSVGWMLHQLAGRTQVFVHGACRGSGVELPAFCGSVAADPGATFGLPELSMGLIPGAGGTVSLPLRIGRHRTAWLAFTGQAIDAATALRWGLVDEIAADDAWTSRP